MELPSWLKIENIIRNLNLSGWFRDCFRYEGRKTIVGKLETNNYIQVLSTNPEEEPTDS